jgi:nucleoside-diphosphate-sugar epimerase
MKVFVTGFPGFLGHQLVPRLLKLGEDVEVHCLVEPRFFDTARALAKDLPPHDQGRLHITPGDIVLPDLGISRDHHSFDEIYHLAAVYDLAVSASVAHNVNVTGTDNVLRFGREQANLKRFHYVSTCYVSGSSTGTFRETDLIRGQRFLNHYEASKYQAELSVQSAMKSGMPVTIYRPSVVVGDSRDGSTQKLDGPYPIIQWMNLLPRIALLPVVGNPSRYRVNLVPSDWLVETLFELSRTPDSINRVFQLCDPDPPTVEEAMEILARASDRRVIKIPMPMPAARALIGLLSRVLPGIDLKPQMLDYFRHPAVHEASDLRNVLGDRFWPCPRLDDYAPAMVDFVTRRSAS